MRALMALILGAEPGPAFDVPIQESSLWMHGPEANGLLEVTPGRWMVRLGQGYGATAKCYSPSSRSRELHIQPDNTGTPLHTWRSGGHRRQRAAL